VAEEPHSNALDEQLLRIHGGRRTACCDQAVRTRRTSESRCPAPRDSFIAEFPLQTKATEEKILATRLRAAGHIYNAVLGEALRVLDLMRESKEWQAARALFAKTQKGERRTPFKAVRARFDFRSSMTDRYAISVQRLLATLRGGEHARCSERHSGVPGCETAPATGGIRANSTSLRAGWASLPPRTPVRQSGSPVEER